MLNYKYFDHDHIHLILSDYQGQLCLCDWATDSRQWVRKRLLMSLNTSAVECTTPLLEKVALQLKEYFSGDRRSFDLPLLLIGTDFQRSVWQGLLSISYGETLSYAALAARIGRPKAVRAVASAARANPLSIIVPCHRLIGSDSSLTGYAGGLEIKRFLLDLERG